MSQIAKCLIAVVSAALVVSTAQAELVFEQSTIELHPGLGDQQAVAHFKYQNKGDKQIAIKNVSTSCGCTAASAKQTAAPGEKGDVTATFTIGDRIGKQIKLITVSTDDAKTPTTTLTLNVFIPQALELKQSLVMWQANEAPTAKTITAIANKDVKLKNVEVTSSGPDFTAKVEPGSGGEYKIGVQPKATDKAIAATITIKATTADGKTKNLFATARVMPRPPTSAPSAATSNNAKATNVAAAVPADFTPKPTIQSKDVTGKFDPCSLLTSDEIKSVQGEPLTSPLGNSKAGGGLVNSQCYFGLPTASDSISLTVTQRSDEADARSPKELWEKTFASAEHEEGEKEKGDQDKEKKEKGKREAGEREEGESLPPRKIDGVGDEAFWSGNRVGGALYVLKGDKFIRISVGGAGDEKSKIEKSKKLAQNVLKRL